MLRSPGWVLAGAIEALVLLVQCYCGWAMLIAHPPGRNAVVAGGAAGAGVGSATTAQVVLPPSCRSPGTASCWGNYDADYAGADLVFPASSGKDLLMLNHAETQSFGGAPPGGPGWSVIGLARSICSDPVLHRAGAAV